MIDQLSELVPFAQAQMRMAFLVFLRVGAMVALLPAFGEQMIPMRLRLAIGVAFTAIVFPLVANNFHSEVASPLIVLGAVEVAAGLIFGLALRLFVHALQIAGAIAAQSVSLSQILGAATADPTPAIGQVLLLGGLTLALILGFHLRLAEYIVLSYDLITVGTAPVADDFTEWGVARVARTFALAFSLAAPFVLASVIYNLALGVINRAMPQLMVAFVGAPAITAGGLIILMLAAPLMLSLWAGLLMEFSADPGWGL